ncbi:MAG TPA: XdhC family protein [Pyrinomonadaceae bacterium]|nr:XdhC family protein [Pyrinomonadaceae bacterium]
MPPTSTITQRLKEIFDEGRVACLVTLVRADKNVGAKLLIDQSGESWGGFGDEELDGAVKQNASSFLSSGEGTSAVTVSSFAPELERWKEAQVMFERIESEPRLVICGAGHVGASLARLAALTGYRATLIDDRPEFLFRTSLPDETIQLVTADNWYDSVRDAIGNGHGVSVAVVTRGHSEDEECMRAVMTSEATYVGMIGSKRRTNIVLERLRQGGADEEKLKRVHAPVGLDIGAVTPEEVALAIMAEIVAHRRGGEGGSLSSWRRK